MIKSKLKMNVYALPPREKKILIKSHGSIDKAAIYIGAVDDIANVVYARMSKGGSVPNPHKYHRELVKERIKAGLWQQ